MNKGLVRSLLFLLCTAVGWAHPRCASAIETESGRLANLIDRLASKDYVLGESVRDDRPYIDPSHVLNAFRHLAAELAWGDLAAAVRKAADFDYEVVEFTDSQTKKEYYVLREDLKKVETIRGWGSYIINPASKVDVLVEVPHPLADAHTPQIGGEVFAACEARGFLLAGTHREKADVPDLVDSIFHQVHAAWVGPFARVTAWQIHGFSSINHSFPRGAQVVASTGDGAIAPEVASLDAVFEERGLTSYVFNELPSDTRANKRLNDGVPGVTFTSLAGAKNEQGRLSRSLGGSFVHVELEGSVRTDEAHRKLAGSAIAAVISRATSRGGDAARTPTLTAEKNGTEVTPQAVGADASQAEEPKVRVARSDRPAEPTTVLAAAAEDELAP